MPAALLSSLLALPPQVEAVAGTLLAGRADLKGGYRLDWQLRPWSLALNRAEGELQLVGADTRLEGWGVVTPFGVELRDLRGRAGAGLLALVPGAPVTGCSMAATVDLARLGWGAGRATALGSLRTPAGNCTDIAGREVPLPAMEMTLTTEGRDASALLTRAGGTALGQVAVTGDRHLKLRVEPAGAALVPGMPTGGATELDYPF